jgi:hypothetical protein
MMFARASFSLVVGLKFSKQIECIDPIDALTLMY